MSHVLMQQSSSPRLGKLVSHTILSRDFSHGTQTSKALISNSIIAIPDLVGLWHGLIFAYQKSKVHLHATDRAGMCVTF